MANPTLVKAISPILPTANMDETIAFYQQVLGFEVFMRSAEYSILYRDGRPIHLTYVESPAILDSVREHTEIYIEVSNIYTLWEHVQSFKDRFRIKELTDRPYGMTEFHIIDPNGALVFVGEVTSQLK